MEKGKVTKRESFTEIRDILAEMERDDLVAVMQNELNLLEKKKASSTKNQEANIGLMARVLDTLRNEFESPATVIEIYDKVRDDEIIKSTQKVVYLLKQLVAQDKVVEIKDKKKNLYSAKRD